MVTYEITALVEPHLQSKFERYMSRQHIPDVLETGFFSGATFSRRENLYRIRYEARSDEALSKYLDNDAARLRADFSIHFPTGVEVRRKSWKVLRTYADRGDYR